MKRNVVLLSLVLGMAGCSSLNVHSDFDHEAPFARYKTFAWRRAPREPASDTPVQARIRTAVDQELQHRGLRPAGAHPADLYVFQVAHTLPKTNVITAPTEVGNNPYPWYGGHNGYSEGTLVVDLVDARTNKVIWHGVATRALDKEPVSDATIHEAVTQLLADYPPKP